MAAVHEEHQRARAGRRRRRRLDDVADHLDRRPHARDGHRASPVVTGGDGVRARRRRVGRQRLGAGEVEGLLERPGLPARTVAADGVEPVTGEHHVEPGRVGPAGCVDLGAHRAAVGRDRGGADQPPGGADDARPVGGDRKPARRGPGDGVLPGPERADLPLPPDAGGLRPVGLVRTRRSHTAHAGEDGGGEHERGRGGDPPGGTRHASHHAGPPPRATWDVPTARPHVGASSAVRRPAPRLRS